MTRASQLTTNLGAPSLATDSSSQRVGYHESSPAHCHPERSTLGAPRTIHRSWGKRSEGPAFMPGTSHLRTDAGPEEGH